MNIGKSDMLFISSRTVSIVIALVLALSSGLSIAATKKFLMVKAGELRVIDVDNVVRVALAKPDIFSYKILENGQILVIGENPGETTFHLWQKNGREISYTVRVTSEALSESLKLARSLVAKVPGLEVNEVNVLLVFSGFVDPKDTEHVSVILGLFENAVNLVTVRDFKYDKMVRIEANVIEINRSDAQQLGIRWDTSMSGPAIGIAKKGRANPYFAVYSGEDDVSKDILESHPVSDDSFYGYFGIATALTSRIDLLAEDGRAKVLATPKLLAKHGESADFRAGGSVPLQTVDNNGNAVVQLYPYGIQLQIEPLIDEQNRISTTIFTKVSAIDQGSAVGLNPGFLEREATSVVNVEDGQTIVLSGLAQASTFNSVTKVPLLGDIPFLGRLFSSRQTNFKETEVLIFLTPHIVAATDERNKTLLDVGLEMKDMFKDSKLNRALMD